jgi:hypothetical protein
MYHELATALSFGPTVIFWLIVIALILSEFVGKLHRGTRVRMRWVALFLVILLVTWYAAETSHESQISVPNFQPWHYFMPSTPQQ